MLYRLPSWELAIWSERLVRNRANRDLMALNIQTYTEWVGEMPDWTPTDAEGWQRKAAYAEGDAARRAFRERLMALASGRPLEQVQSSGLTQDEFGWRNARGQYVASSAAEIEQILSARLGMFNGALDGIGRRAPVVSAN